MVSDGRVRGKTTPASSGGSFKQGANTDPDSTLTVDRPYADNTPAECDNKLATLWGFRSTVARQRNGIQSRLDGHYQEVDDIEEHGERQTRWSNQMTPRSVTEAHDLIDKLDARILELDREIAPIDEEFDARGGWTRFYLVRNSGGHVHSSRACSTCYPTTEFVWLPDFSGSNEAETVELAGDSACSVCFPTAPTADRNRPRPNQLETADVLQARADRAAAKLVKAAKAEKNSMPYVVKNPADSYRSAHTYNEAKREATDTLVDLYAELVSPPREGLSDERKAWVDELVTALAIKEGTTEAEAFATYNKKGHAKFKREYSRPAELLTDWKERG